MMATQLERPTFFDLFKSHCSSDLGAISLNWFEELSAEALPYESKEYEEHELGSDWLGENVIQTPKQKPATYSQLESTPVIFKEQVFSSPLFRSPKAKQEKSHVADKNNCEKASASQSIPQHEITEVFSPSSRYLNESPALMKEIFKTPLRDCKYLHGTPQRDGKADICTSLFCTPKLMRNQSPKGISESLGAEVDPEMSWSSSLATPPSPTVIIARAHDQSFRPKALEQRNAVIVQSLFSKRSNVTEKCILAPLPVLNENDATTFVGSEVKPDVSLSKRNVSAEASSSTIRAPWKQAISSAIKDDSICQTVENVLDGMEDVLSIFFTSEKNTGLRKVKADHRIRRKNSINSETKNNKSLLKGNGQENALNEHLEYVNHIPSINCSKGRSKEDLEEKIQSRETYEWSQLNLCDFTGSPLDTVALDASDDGLSNWCKYSQEHKNKLESQNVERVAVNTENNASVVDCNLASEKTLTVVEESDVPIVDHCTACQRKDTETLQRMNIAGKHQTVTNNMPASVDKPVAALRNTPQGAHGKNNTLFSAMKKQSRFVYSINWVLNDQDWRNKEDITRVSSSDHLCISDGQTKEYDGEQMDLYTVERSQEKVVLKGNKIGEALSFYEREEIVLCTENEETNPSELYKVSSSIKRKVQATASLLARKRLKVEALGKQELKTYPEMQKYIPQTSKALHVAVSTLNQTEGHVASPKMALSTCNVNQIHIVEGKPKKLSCSLALPQHVQLDQPAHVVALPECSEKRIICSANSRNKYEEPCLGNIDDVLKVVTIKQDTGEAALGATECSGQQNLFDFTDLQHPSLCERKSTIPNHKMNAIRGPFHLPDTQRKTFNDFKTSLNKNIYISEENMKKGQTLFMGLESQGLRGCFEDKNEENKCSLETLSSADGPISKGNAKGFRTASNKQINISASTFAKGRLLFKDIEDAKSEVLWSAKERTVDPKPSSYILVDKTGTAHKEKPDASENIDNILLKKQKVPLNVDHKEEGGGINMLTINKQSPVENVPTNENTEPHHIKSIQSLTIPRKDTLYLPFSAEVKRISTQESSTKILSHLNEGLTESQKVEVGELSAILENAGSQLEFTQFRKASAGGINTEFRQNLNQGESQSLNNSDVWKDVDFNDSFAAGEDKAENIDTGLSSTEIAQAANERHSEGTLDTASFSKLIKSSLMPSDVHSFQKLEKKTLGGFSFASGKPVNIADEVLVKAKELFNNLEDSDELFKCFVNDSRHSNCCSESTPKDLTKGKCETMATGFAKCNTESVLDCNNCTFSVSSVLGSNVALDCNVDERNHKDALSKNHCITVNDRSFSAGCNVLKKISPFHTALGINKNCEEKLTSHSEQVDNDKEELSNQNSSRVLPMKGFQTARGKDIMFSPSSLEKVRNIFADDCPESISLLCNTSNQTHVAQSRRNMEKGVLAHKPAILAQPQKPLPCNSNCEDFKLGFSTSSGKKVIISEDSLAKVRHLFDEEGKCVENEGAGLKQFDKQGRKTEDAFPGKRQILGEETRNHKSAVAAEEYVSSLGSDHEGDVCNKIGDHFTSTHKAEKLEDWAFNQNVVINSAECTSTLSFGFTTGKGKKISVGEESLLKAKNIFNDLNAVSYNTPLLNRTQCPHVKETITPASENRIESSTNAIIKQYTEKINNTESKVITSNGISTCAAAFSTASGKSVAVSHDSLQKARQMFSESSHDDHPLDSETEEELRQNPRKEQGNECITVLNTSEQLCSIRPPSSFATASNKEVDTDKTSLKPMEMECSGSKDIVTIPPLVEKPFQADIVKEVFFQEQNVCLPEAVSFSTASGKSVQWSEEALKKAREMFSEIDISHFPVPQTQDRFCMENTKAALNEEEVKIVQNEAHISKKKPLLNTSTNSNCFGFSTASGKHVSVSETALEKAKGMLQDIGDVTEDDPLFKKQFPAEIAGSSSMLNTTKDTASLDNKFSCFQNNTKIKFKSDYKNRLAQTHCPDNPSCPSPLPVSGRDSTPTVKEMTGLSNKSKTNVFFTTHTPENYFEIEAAESAKAFMDDGELTDAGLLTDNAHSSSNTMNKRLGKRLRTEEETLRGEPLIKRQLLPEFDRATDNRPNLLLKPLTSTPEGTLKDRRTFLHNVTLKPVTCEPASFSTGRKDTHIPKFTARNQCHPNSNIFQHTSVLKSDDVLSPPVDHISSSCTPSAENSNNLPITKRAVRTFIPPFKKKPGLSADLKVHPLRSDGDGQAGNVTEDPREENEVKLIPLILGNRPHESDLLEIISNLQCGRDMQEMRIRKKQRQKIKLQPGSLYLVKNSSAARIPLQAAVQGKRPSVYSEKKLHMYGVVKNHFGVGSENAASFQFDCMDYFTKDHLMSGNGVQLADGGWLIPTDKGKAGKEEIYRALCDTPGVDPKLISQEWVYNHYRWIVWKLAALEVTFPEIFACRCLTPERLLLQLKYRYDVEIDKSQRSAIKRIMERDDSPAKTLVLCISKIISAGSGLPNSCNNKNESGDSKQSTAVIEVTDGWYSIKALLDPALTNLLHRGRLFIGQKIIVHGAEITGSDDACTPLEAPDTVMLKIAANSTRPACWYTRLGYFRDPRPFCLPLSSLFSEGGIVGCVDVVIQRIYPIQWMEKMANGLYIFRNDRAEEREAEKYTAKQQKNLEVLFTKIQSEFEQREECSKKKGLKRRSLNDHQICALQDGAELYEALQNESDPGYLESCLSSEQLRALQCHRQHLNDKKQAEIQAEFRKAIESSEQGPNSCIKRDVTAVWKMRIVDHRDQDTDTAYILNIWRPLPDVLSLLKEGIRFKIYHLAASQSKSKSEVSEIHFTATKKTRFQQLQPSQKILEKIYSPREVIQFSRFLDPFFRALYAEVDVVGLVISTYRKAGAAPVVYLSDDSYNLIAVKFWTDLGQLALEDITKPCTFIAASNLRWRAEGRSEIPTIYAGDFSFISSNPKECHLLKALQELKHSIQCVQDLCNEAVSKLRNLLQVTNPEERRSPADRNLEPHTPTSKPGISGERSATPLALGEKKQNNLAYSPEPSSGAEVELKTCKKRKGLDFLCRIPSPPPVTPVRAFVSPALQKAFRPPRSNNVQKDVTGTKGKSGDLHSTQSHRNSTKVADAGGEFVADEELAMINTQALTLGVTEQKGKTMQEFTVVVLKGAERDLPALVSEARTSLQRNKMATANQTQSTDKNPQVYQRKLQRRTRK